MHSKPQEYNIATTNSTQADQKWSYKSNGNNLGEHWPIYQFFCEGNTL